MKTVIFLIWVEFLPGLASIALDPRCQVPTGQHVLSISPGHGLAPNATVTAEVNAFMYMHRGVFWLPFPSTYLFNLYICSFFYSCCMWKQRSLRAPTMLCHYAPRSPRPRKWTWIAPSCRMAPSSPPSPPFSPDSKWNAVQVDSESECDALRRGGRGLRWQRRTPR